jgi:hypothetical protein
MIKKINQENRILKNIKETALFTLSQGVGSYMDAGWHEDNIIDALKDDFSVTDIIKEIEKYRNDDKNDFRIKRNRILKNISYKKENQLESDIKYYAYRLGKIWQDEWNDVQYPMSNEAKEIINILTKLRAMEKDGSFADDTLGIIANDYWDKGHDGKRFESKQYKESYNAFINGLKYKKEGAYDNYDTIDLKLVGKKVKFKNDIVKVVDFNGIDYTVQYHDGSYSNIDKYLMYDNVILIESKQYKESYNAFINGLNEKIKYAGKMEEFYVTQPQNKDYEDYWKSYKEYLENFSKNTNLGKVNKDAMLNSNPGEMDAAKWIKSEFMIGLTGSDGYVVTLNTESKKYQKEELLDIYNGMKDDGVDSYAVGDEIKVNSKSKKIKSLGNIGYGDYQLTFTDGTYATFYYDDLESDDNLKGEWKIKG